MSDKLLTTDEVAEFLSVNAWRVREYIRLGQLKATKLGNGTGKRGNKRHWRIWKHDLVAFVNRSSNAKKALGGKG